MKKKLITLMALVIAAPALAQNASEYLSKVFNGAGVSGTQGTGFVKSTRISCAELNFSVGKSVIQFPVRAVNIAVLPNGGIRFDCINGGGCITGLYDHGVNYAFLNGFTSEIEKSIINAFGAFQDSCGGKDPRPF
jgi:hypothetical protein